MRSIAGGSTPGAGSSSQNNVSTARRETSLGSSEMFVYGG